MDPVVDAAGPEVPASEVAAAVESAPVIESASVVDAPPEIEEFVPPESEQPAPPAEAPAAEPPKPAAAPAKAPEPPAEDEPVSRKLLNQKLNANPQLKGIVEADPKLKNFLHALTSRAEEVTKYRDLFPTVQIAEFAAEQAKDFGTLSDLFQGDGFNQSTGQPFKDGMESAYAFLTALRDRTAVLGEDGKPVVKDGQPQYSGRFIEICKAVREDLFATLRSHAEKGQRTDVLETLDALKQYIDEVAGVPAATDPSTLPADVRRKLEEAEAANLQRQETSKAEMVRYNNDRAASTKTEIRSRLGGYLEKITPTLKPEERDALFEGAYAKFSKAVLSNPMFTQNYRALMRQTGPTGIANMANYCANVAKNLMGNILKEMAAEKNQAAVQKNQATHQQLGARVDKQKAQAEPRGGGGAPSPTTPGPQARLAEAKKLKAQLKAAGVNGFNSDELTTQEKLAATTGEIIEEWTMKLAAANRAS
ncbi:MAG TPA: hypothetical protein VNH83_25990 [Bryobacteraceae bacterium]|nr:hypothetical protein [Bryobacteraceae bacterium]